MNSLRLVVKSEKNKDAGGLDKDDPFLPPREIRDYHGAVATLREQVRARFNSAYTSGLRDRVKLRLKHEFLGRPVREKVRFILLSLKWLGRRTWRKLSGAKGTIAIVRERPAIAFKVTGGIGDLVNANAFLRAFNSVRGSRVVDIYYHSPEIAQFVLSGVPGMRTFLPDNLWEHRQPYYDIAGEVSDFVNYTHVNEGELGAHEMDLLCSIRKSRERIAEQGKLVKYHPLLSNLFAMMSIDQGRDRVSSQIYFAGLESDQEARAIIDLPASAEAIIRKFSLEGRKFITIHDGFDNEIVFAGAASPKQWTLSHWSRLLRLIKADFPGLVIVQLGSLRSREITGVDINLISKTSLMDVAAIMAKAKLHIDGESGLVRLGWAVGTRSVVMFGPTMPEYFQLPGNGTVSSTHCANCYYLTQDWMMRCPIGLSEPICMSGISPEVVLSKIREFLDGHA